MCSEMNWNRFFGLILFLAAPAAALFRTKEEEHRFLEERHHEQREHIHRSMSADQTVYIIVTVNETCTQSLPTDFEYSNGKPMKVTIQTYEYMYLHKNDLCISMIEYDPLVELGSFVTNANDVTQEGIDLVTKEYESWGVTAVLQNKFPPNNSWRGDGRPPVGVCIVDSGVKVDHPDFPYASQASAKVEGKEFEVGDALWNLPHGMAWHGTFVAGLMCAERGNTKGIMGIIGDCGHKVNLYVARVFGEDFSPTARMSTVDKAVEWCLSKGARVVNLSLATPVYNYNSHVIHKNIREQNVALIVAAAGNNGPDAPPSYPAYFEEVLSVGAVDRNMNIASFSQKHVNCVAPGVDVISTSTNFGVESDNTGHKVMPMIFSAIPGEVQRGPVCDCGCGITQCTCSQPSSVCMVERCANSGISATNQAENAEAAGCAGLIITAPDLSAVYSDNPNFAYQSTIPVVYAEKAEAESIKSSVRQSSASEVTIDFAYPVYKITDGTSFAAPYAAGLATLLLYERPLCNASQIRDAIVNSALPISGDPDLVGTGFIQGEPAYQLLLQEPVPCGLVDESATSSSTTDAPVVAEEIDTNNLFNMFADLASKKTYGSSSTYSSYDKEKSFSSGRQRGTSLRRREI